MRLLKLRREDWRKMQMDDGKEKDDTIQYRLFYIR